LAVGEHRGCAELSPPYCRYHTAFSTYNSIKLWPVLECSNTYTTQYIFFTLNICDSVTERAGSFSRPIRGHPSTNICILKLMRHVVSRGTTSSRGRLNILFYFSGFPWPFWHSLGAVEQILSRASIRSAES
jgi:hypothetical protein